MSDGTYHQLSGKPVHDGDIIVPPAEECEHDFARLNDRRWCCKCGADGGPWMPLLWEGEPA